MDFARISSSGAAKLMRYESCTTSGQQVLSLHALRNASALALSSGGAFHWRGDLLKICKQSQFMARACFSASRKPLDVGKCAPSGIVLVACYSLLVCWLLAGNGKRATRNQYTCTPEKNGATFLKNAAPSFVSCSPWEWSTGGLL